MLQCACPGRAWPDHCVFPTALKTARKYIACDIVIAHAMYLCFEGRMTAPDQRLIWLLSRAQRRVMAQSDAAIAGLGLTSTQAGALFCIRSEDGVTVSELADQLDLAQSAASGLAQRLETAGLVTR